jgi:sortase A
MVLGIACIGWALVNIRAQSVSPVMPIRVASTGDGVVPTRSVTPSGTAAEKVVYPKSPAGGETLGSLSIPALRLALPIIQGTGTDELKKGVGHMTKTALPGEDGNCVLSGHRDTVFTQLGKVKTGDELIVQTAAGTFTYKVKRIRIVHKDDTTVVVHTDHAVLTVSTCYPFRYMGAAPDRYVLIADLVAP